MQWFRRDAARNAGQKTSSRVFSLGGLVGVTVLLALTTALVALPLKRVRERQMTDAARAELGTLVGAVEQYRAVHYRFPDAVRELETVGYSPGGSIVVCRFRHVPDLRNFDDHLELAVRHRASGTALVTRYPSRGQTAEVPVTEACGTTRTNPTPEIDA